MVAKAMNIQTSDWYIMRESQIYTGEKKKFDVEEVIQFHKTSFDSGDTEFAITSIDYVDYKLKEPGIPSGSMMIPEKSIIDTIHTAITLGIQNRD